MLITILQRYIASLENSFSYNLHLPIYSILLKIATNNLASMDNNRTKGEVKAKNQDKGYKKTADSEEVQYLVLNC